jgi:hypothetical protein
MKRWVAVALLLVIVLALLAAVGCKPKGGGEDPAAAGMDAKTRAKTMGKCAQPGADPTAGKSGG